MQFISNTFDFILYFVFLFPSCVLRHIGYDTAGDSYRSSDVSMMSVTGLRLIYTTLFSDPSETDR